MIYKQSVFEPWPIESETIQAICTSPPYFALRKYAIPDVIIGGNKDCKHEFEIVTKRAGGGTNGTVGNNIDTRIHYEAQSGICLKCRSYKGQYGLEPTPQMYVEHTRLWAKEAWRVLKNDGVLFLNLADSYSGGGRGYGGKSEYLIGNGAQNPKLDYPNKCQLLIPPRVAIALVDGGWTLRNKIIWYKSNAMPESVTDRFSKKYEYIFMFTKQEKYYFDLDSVRETIITKNRAGIREKYNSKFNDNDEAKNQTSLSKARQLKRSLGLPEGHINGKNPGDVWVIPTQPSSEKHYALWPERLVERMVRCSTKAGDIVLDPFAGSATTLKVAEQLNRKGIGIDLGYHEISKRRTGKIQKEMFV